MHSQRYAEAESSRRVLKENVEGCEENRNKAHMLAVME